MAELRRFLCISTAHRPRVSEGLLTSKEANCTWEQEMKSGWAAYNILPDSVFLGALHG